MARLEGGMAVADVGPGAWRAGKEGDVQRLLVSKDSGRPLEGPSEPEISESRSWAQGRPGLRLCTFTTFPRAGAGRGLRWLAIKSLVMSGLGYDSWAFFKIRFGDGPCPSPKRMCLPAKTRQAQFLGGGLLGQSLAGPHGM